MQLHLLRFITYYSTYLTFHSDLIESPFPKYHLHFPLLKLLSCNASEFPHASRFISNFTSFMRFYSIPSQKQPFHSVSDHFLPFISNSLVSSINSRLISICFIALFQTEGGLESWCMHLGILKAPITLPLLTQPETGWTSITASPWSSEGLPLPGKG